MFIIRDYILAAAEQFGWCHEVFVAIGIVVTHCRYPMCDSSIWSYCQDIGDMPVPTVTVTPPGDLPCWRPVAMVVVAMCLPAGQLASGPVGLLVFS